MILRRALPLLLALGVSAAAARAAEPAPAAPATPPGAAKPIPTVIESGSADMVSTPTETTFTFRENVSVTATNMKLTCDLLVVVARRSGDANATIGKQEQFKSLIATGNVRIVQADREATCGRAAVYPGEDKVELTENPVVRSVKEGWVQTGPKMILYRGERRAVVEGTATERPRLVLPALKDLGDLGDDGKKKKAPAKDAPASSPPADPASSQSPTITVPLSPPTK